jgi:predicted Zn-dependent peptidase
MMSHFFSTIQLAVKIVFLMLIVSTGFAQSNTIEFTAAGIKVILHQTQKETVVMSMYFKGGSTNYSAENAGIESLALSGAVECGTSNYTASEFNDQVDENGLHLGADAGNDFGVITLKCISRYSGEAWKLFSAAIAAPVFESQKFELLKQQKISELNLALSNADTRLSELAKEFAFAGTPYAINPDGTETTLMALNRDAVKEYYYNTLLNKNRMFLVIAGNVSKEDIEAKITAAFSGIPDKPYTGIDIASQVFAEDVYTIENRPLATNYVCGLVNAPGLSSPDYPAYRIAVVILNSSIYETIRLSKHLSYAPAAFLSAGKISYTTVYASTSQPRETVRAMRSVLSFVKSKKFPYWLIEDLKKSLLQSYQKQQETMNDVAAELGKAEIMGNWKLAENLNSRMQPVSADDVNEVFNRYVKKIVWAYVGDEDQGISTFN